VASEEDDLTSLSYITYLERYATVQPATQEDGLEAVINMPLVSGDRIDTAREARVEVQLADGSVLWLDEYSSVSFDAVAFSRDTGGDRTVLYLVDGTIMLEIPEHSLTTQSTRIDGESGTVYLNEPGLYRLEKLRNGGLRVEVWLGLAEASSSSGGVLVRPESAAEVRAGDVTGIEEHLSLDDEFAAWVDQRRREVAGDSSRHVDLRYQREAGQLDNYGNWVYLDSNNSWAWQPSVAAGWSPYTAGRWYWTPVGWSWVSHEPWGWLPYHYGSWNFHVSFGWVWNWGSCWSPAWVNWCHWGGYVGWSPSGYYDWWYWNRYSGWYGYPGHPTYPSPHQPPRSNVQPRPQRQLPPVQTGEPVHPSRLALDVSGAVKVAQMDPTPWNVVAVDDFASPHLTRLVQPAESVFRASQGVDGVVLSGPLVTSNPSVQRPQAAVEGVFRGIDTTSSPDVTPVLARQGDLAPERAVQLVQPTTTAALSRRGVAPSTTTTSPTSTAPQAAPSQQAELQYGSRSAPAQSSVDTFYRRTMPNIYRSSLVPGGGGLGGATRGGAGPSSPGASTIPTLRGGNLTSGRPTTTYVPSTGSRPLVVPGSSGTTPRRVSPRTTTSSSPVIVPRTSPPRTSGSPSSSVRRSPTARRYSAPSSSGVRRYSAPSSRSPSRAYVPRSSSSSRSAPRTTTRSAPRSAPSRSAPSARSSGGSRSTPSARPSGGSRSSSSSSRPSSGSSRRK
jgi:hypothetical protein